VSAVEGLEVGTDFEIEEVGEEDQRTTAPYGGFVREWVPVENARMRRRIVNVLLVALVISVVACAFLLSQGVAPLVVVPFVFLVSQPFRRIIKYYFHEGVRED